MNLIRTRHAHAVPVSADVLEPFRLMRNLLRWDPYRDFNPGSEGASLFTPSFDVKESADAYLFTADMPGIRKEDLDLQLAGNRLAISGKREIEAGKENERVHCQERSFGTFSRTFALPEEVDAAKVVAELRDGVLHLMVPKSPEVRPQKIEISRS